MNCSQIKFYEKSDRDELSSEKTLLLLKNDFLLYNNSCSQKFQILNLISNSINTEYIEIKVRLSIA